MRIRPLAKLAWKAAVEWWNDNTFRLAAALAFYTIFSLAPLLVIAVAVAGAFFGEEQARNQIVGEIERLAGPQGGEAVRQVTIQAGLEGGSTLAVTISVITLLVGSTIVFAELQSALNDIWRVKAEPRNGIIVGFVRDRLLSFALVLVTAFLLLVSLVVSAGLSAARDALTRWMPSLPWIWRAADVVVSLLVVTLLFAMIYKLLPDVRITWRDVAIGAIATALLFALGKELIGLYLGRMAVGSKYGAAGSFVVFLVWVYYSALICFYGAEFTHVYAREYGSWGVPKAHARPQTKGSEAK